MKAPPPFHSPPPEAPTVADLVRYGADEFELSGLVYGHGTDNAVDESAALVFHALALDHAHPAEAYGQRVAPDDAERVLELFRERIVRRVPAAYLMGRMWFAGLEFEVDPGVIVPRSPFAELIAARFEPWIDPAAVHTVLDVGTGSGCIAIACAKAFPGATVDAVDVSPVALAVARRNVVRHGVGDRLNLLEGDVFAPVGERRYDLIVSNPPYVSDAEMTALPAEYRHEPDVALRAGEDGLETVRRILAGAAQHLEPEGALFVEVGDSDERLSRAFPRLPFTWLDFEHGGGGVFMLRRNELQAPPRRGAA
ncbi:MAG: 50S ribosomal protein L3 N(5)-glutamine methyltransferase [Steroidobacteraceae bacterium]